MLRKILGMDSKRKLFFIYIAIIALQLVVMLYWANEKTNFVVDELFSMGYASNYTGEGDTTPYVTASPEWKDNEWINNASLKKYLIVEEDERIFNLSFFRIVKKIILGKNYFGFLNMAESIAGYSFVSAWPGIVLNMIIFIIAEIALLLFMYRIKMNACSQCLALAMFGFSSQAIGLVEFIRFYIIVIMYMLWMLNLFYVVWNSSNSLKKIIPAELGILGLAYLAFRNSQLTMIFFGAFSFCFVIALALSKKWKPIISYMVMGLCGVVYIWRTTDYIGILIHPTNYLQISNKAVAASLSIAAFSIDLIKTNLLKFMQYLGEYYFGDYFIALMAAAVLILYSVWICRRKKDDELPIGCCKVKLRDFKLSSESGFVIVLLGTAVIYTVVIAMANITQRRYFCIASVLFYIVFWYILDQILTKFVRRELVSGWYIILTVFVALNAVVPFKTRNIPLAYLHEDDRSFISALEPYREMDIVMPTHSVIEIYDCVNLMSENSYIYTMAAKEYFYDEESFTDEFVLWARNDGDISPILRDLAERGYKIESLGQDHISQAYVCRINEKERQ